MFMVRHNLELPVCLVMFLLTAYCFAKIADCCTAVSPAAQEMRYILLAPHVFCVHVSIMGT